MGQREMRHTKNNLFEAFHADHAALGRGFHDLSQCLRSNDPASAQRVARSIDAVAGAHIAFEEEHFYPALLPLLGKTELKRMYREHRDGLEVVRRLLQHPPEQALDQALLAELLHQSEAMESHIAECGELFAAMGRIPAEDQTILHRHLLQWRERAPRWSDFAASRVSARPPTTSEP
jgi:hypothetical protein